MTLALWPALCLALTAGCSGERFQPRVIVLASSRREVDQATQRARQIALEGDLDGAQELLQSAIERFPRDPLAPVASVLLARVQVARGDLAGAERVLAATSVSSDPVLTLKVSLVRGVIAARRRQGPQSLALLRPLVGQLPDRAETGELSCGLAESEGTSGEPGRALQALAMIESLQGEGSGWLPTGLSCEQADTRSALLGTVLERIDDPQSLANTVDALPASSSMRRPVEQRLHALAGHAHEVSRWIRWLGDLPDETDVNAGANGMAQRPPLVVGILAPGHGPRASLGASVLRAVQFALERVDDVRTVPEDEGDSPEAARAALDRLYAQGTRVVVGVLHEDLSPAVAIRAQALGIDAWLLAPTRGVEGTGARVHIAGPTVDARADGLLRELRAMRQGGRGRVSLLASPPATEVRQRLERALSDASVPWTDVGVDELSAQAAAAGGLTVVLGTVGREARTVFARAAARGPSRWLFEARAVAPSSPGVLVGVAPGPGFAAFLPEYCLRVGEPPDELSLLAYDAARRGVAFARGEREPPALLALVALAATVRFASVYV
ncbi:MAG: tetratricopeptide repeat protein, partial [Deltaproteobacteria bacterium]